MGELREVQLTLGVRFTTFSTTEFTSERFATESYLILDNTSRSSRESSGTKFRLCCKRMIERTARGRLAHARVF